jgi:hypothetical protein
VRINAITVPKGRADELGDSYGARRQGLRPTGSGLQSSAVRRREVFLVYAMALTGD